MVFLDNGGFNLEVQRQHSKEVSHSHRGFSPVMVLLLNPKTVLTVYRR